MQRRVKAPDKADEQWRLALWCEQNGLNEQALAHLHRVVQLDPRRDAAWRRLGYKKTAQRWTKPELLTAEKAELDAQVRANKFWKPRLEHLREALGGRDRGKQAAGRTGAGPDHRSPRRAHGLVGLRHGATRPISEPPCRFWVRWTPRAPRVPSAC